MKKTNKPRMLSALTSAFSLQPSAFLLAFSIYTLAFLASGCALPRRHAAASHTLEAFRDRPDGLIRRESWKDTEGGGGFFLFADPNVQAMSAIHTNQRALGGGSAFATGSFTILVDSNLVPAIAAAGTATGNIIGAAAKSAVK